MSEWGRENGLLPTSITGFRAAKVENASTLEGAKTFLGVIQQFLDQARFFRLPRTDGCRNAVPERRLGGSGVLGMRVLAMKGGGK